IATGHIDARVIDCNRKRFGEVVVERKLAGPNLDTGKVVLTYESIDFSTLDLPGQHSFCASSNVYACGVHRYGRAIVILFRAELRSTEILSPSRVPKDAQCNYKGSRANDGTQPLGVDHPTSVCGLLKSGKQNHSSSLPMGWETS